jgi:Spy/CpxP family protein refolding chaperone
MEDVMSHTNRLLLASLSFLMVAASVACFAFAADPPANPPGRQVGAGGGGAGGFNLFTNPTVQKDLALTDAQKESIKKIVDDFRASLTGLTQEDRRSKMPELRKVMDDKVDSVLNSQQKARVKEIRLQVRGVAALTSKEVVETLKLTDDQVNKIKELTAALRKDTREARQAAVTSGDRSSVREAVAKVRKEGTEKIMAVLTPDQKAGLEKMQGAKIELPTGVFFGGGRNRGGN